MTQELPTMKKKAVNQSQWSIDQMTLGPVFSSGVKVKISENIKKRKCTAQQDLGYRLIQAGASPPPHSGNAQKKTIF